MKILGIETSCDETAIAVLDITPRQALGKEITVLSNVISSQVKLHAKYGGVVPNLAAREHEKNLPHIFRSALKKSKSKITDINLIAVTRGPGLSPSLWRGINFAKEISEKYKKPILGVNHLEGHIYSNWLNPDFKSKSVKFPILNLIVSGGHTELVLMTDHGKYKVIGETLDDAVGEAFDKVARLLGLGYPGGPAISKIAEQGNSTRFPLPRPMLYSKNFDFSFSGLKTAVLYLVRDLKENKVKINKQTKADIAASFQESAVDVLIQKTVNATKEFGVDSIMLSGGVSANALLRSRFRKIAEEMGVRYSRPHIAYTGDNAAMIAVAGYFNYSKNKKIQTAYDAVEMDANLGF